MNIEKHLFGNFWKNMGEWNIREENILEGKRIKVEKNGDWNFQLLSKTDEACVTCTKISVLSGLKNIIF